MKNERRFDQIDRIGEKILTGDIRWRIDRSTMDRMPPSHSLLVANPSVKIPAQNSILL